MKRDAHKAGATRLALVLMLLALQTWTGVHAATGVAEPVWESSIVVDGVVTGIYTAGGVIYAAVSGNESSYIYTVDPGTGTVLWGATLEGLYPIVRPLSDTAIVATATGSGGLLYRVEAGQATLLVNATIGRPSVRITAAAPTASGVLVLVGGKYHVGTGVDVYVAGYTGDGMQWNTTTPTLGDQYLNTIAVGVDDTVCAAGPDGDDSTVLLCTAPTGKLLKQESYTGKGKPMALAVYDKDNHALALYNGGNTTMIVYRDGARDEITLEATVVTSITYTGKNKLAMVGATGGAPILIELEYTSAGRQGNVYAIQLENLAPLAVARIQAGYLVGGETEGTPTIALINAVISQEQMQPNVENNKESNSPIQQGNDGEILLLISSILILLSSFILGYVIYKKRRNSSSTKNE